MIVMKFGGSSLGSLERIEHVADLVAGASGRTAVVASAMSGTTDRLLRAAALAEQGDGDGAAEQIDAILEQHLAVAGSDPVRDEIEGLIASLRARIQGVVLLRETTPRTRALVVSHGERLSVRLVAAALVRRGVDAFTVDAREIVRTDAVYEEAGVDREATRELIRDRLASAVEAGRVPVITGFIGSTAAGVTTTLGRSGSDYTASLIGAGLDADEVWIWTDVDGVLTADPRLVKEARTLRQVSYGEAAEMSYFGAQVLHPRTMGPCADRGIPIRIRSTFTPDRPGTLVAAHSEPVPEGVKTVTSIRGMALVTLEGRGMAGVPGVARRIFEATERAEANVVMISQASSEQTVSLVVRQQDAEPGLVEILSERFRPEIVSGEIERVRVDRDAAVLSIIGEGMAGRPGISGKLFAALGASRVNVLAIAQGAAEQSISVVVEEDAVTRAVRGVHTVFGLTRVVHLVLIGCGRVGRALLAQLDDTREMLAGEDIELRLVGLANRTRWLEDLDGLDASAVDRLAQAEERPDDEALVAQIAAERHTDVILVDVTAADTGELHRIALEAGFHVVTANKVPLSGPMDSYDALVAARDARGVHYGYETTFGAGLPVLHTLKELVITGDELLRVSGCFSGTLGFVCSCLQGGDTLSAAVQQAADLGYTEPDPREDLSGRDVARKALIVARAMGRRLEPTDVVLEPLVPGLDAGLDVALSAHQPVLAAQMADAAARDSVLRYVAEITPDRVSVGMRDVPAAGPIGGLQGPDNILVFHTARYREYPLVIRGPGAGAEVTAAGVLGDILKIAKGAS